MRVQSLLAAWLVALTTVQIIETNAYQDLEERIRLLDKQHALRLQIIETRLGKLENTIMTSLERSQMANERMERKLNIIWKDTQSEFNQNSRSSSNNNKHIDLNTTTQSLAKDSLALANATRRELAEAVRIITRRVSETGSRLEKRFSRVMANHDQFLDSYHRIQSDSSSTNAHIAETLLELILTFREKSNITFAKLHEVQALLHAHDSRVMKSFNKASAHLDFSVTAFAEKVQPLLKQQCPGMDEVNSLTTKLIDLTERADSALTLLHEKIARLDEQQPTTASTTTWPKDLNMRLHGHTDSQEGQDFEKEGRIASEADSLISKLKSIGEPVKEDEFDDLDEDWDDEGMEE